MKTKIIMVFVVILSALAGFFANELMMPGQAMEAEKAGSEEPLYWVAPMDSSYRRDKPGKSPMGMDLVPVYKDDTKATMDDEGTVRISPDVVNNLGVRTQAVKKGKLHTNIRTVGYVKYDEDKLKHIHPRVEGWIEKLYIKASGDPVVKGEPIYELYSPQLVNAQEEYLLALGRNNNNLVAAAGNRLRALNLSDEFIANLKITRQVKQTIHFYALQNGVVDNLKIREGFFVQPGTTLMSIGSLEDVWVEAEVFERQALMVKKGQPVTMKLDYLEDREWQGEVDYVYPTLDAENRTARVRMRFANADYQLKPNMFAQIVIHIDSEEENILVPRESVIRTADNNVVVLALGEGRFRSVEVDIGRSDDQHFEVLKGLSPNDVVVTSAQFLLDSESSKQSGFKRLHHDEDKPRQNTAHQHQHHDNDAGSEQ